MTFKRPKEKMPDKALKAWRLNGFFKALIEGIFVGAYWIVNARFFQWPSWIGTVLTVLFLVVALLHILIIPKIRMIYWGYQINEQDIDIQYGIIVVKRILVPMQRIQHVDTEHGPILRLFGLATLIISTAGTNHKIPALEEKTAEQLRRQISTLAQASEEDV
ncbi:MAG: PH domain-containing protein [Bacillota bacterium]